MHLSAEAIRTFLQSHRRVEVHNPALRRAGVLVLFHSHEGEMHILFTRRTATVEHHKGQVSFPGGSSDEADTNIVATALREAREEVGIDPRAVSVLGLFDDFQTPSGFCITPVIGYSERIPALTPNEEEVEDVFSVPAAFFLNPGNEHVEHRSLGEKQYELYRYRYGTHEIWGATAAILRTLLRTMAVEFNGSQHKMESGSRNIGT